MEKCFEKIESTGILPVINIKNEELAVPLTRAFLNGGLGAVEITLRSECALRSIKKIKDNFPEVVVGAGTVLTMKNVDDAIACGADFIVSPGFDEELVGYCQEKKIPVVPGCSTPSEIQKAIKMGLEVLKFFPAEKNGGIKAIKALSGPFSQVKFIPTGGINLENLASYLENDKVLACGGSFMATNEQMDGGKFDEIEKNCKKALEISLGFEFAHVGINNDNEETALDGAKKLSKIFGLTPKDKGASIFTNTCAEFMKTNFYGTKGHLGFKTNSVKRALAYLKNNGYEIIEESVKSDEKGLLCAYLKDEICGFAVHVVRK